MVRKSVMTGLLMVAMLVLIPGMAVGADSSPFVQGFIEGYLLSLGADEQGGRVAEIEIYSGQRFILTVHPQAQFMIDNRPVREQDLRAGMEVYGSIQGRQLTSLEAYSTANLGFIGPGSKVRKGIITQIDRDTLKVRSADGKENLYHLAPASLLLRNGQSTTADTLYTGDRVKLFFDDLYSDMISRLEVQGDSILVKDLYRGQLSTIDDFSNRILIKSLERFVNGGWQAAQAAFPMTYSRDLPMFYGGQTVPERNWKYYQGKTVYLISKNLLGRETIDRLLVKNQYEPGYSDKITSINWFTETMELAGNRNLSLHPGSVIIKNGRLQDPYALSPNDDAYIIADGSGISRTANVIYIYNTDINPSSWGQHFLYCGRLEQIADDRVWLEDFYILNQNEWEAYRNEKELYYDLDTDLYDLENRQTLSAAELYAGNYTVDEDEERADEQNLKDWYAYIYTDGDRIAAMAVQKTMDSLLGQRVTAGRIAGLTEDSLVGWTVLLNDSRDWSNRKDEWMPKTSDLRVNLDRAVIIREGRIIAADDLKPGQRLFLIRDDFRARVVIVQ